jgi:hypothetical protein
MACRAAYAVVGGILEPADARELLLRQASAAVAA